MSVASLGPGEGHTKLEKIGLVSDGFGWVKTWCGLILVWGMSGVGYFSLVYVMVWVDFDVGYVTNGVVWDMLRCGICRCGISWGTKIIR